VKPEGTTSRLLNTGSGIHARHARRYFRRVQANRIDPVFQFFKQHNPHLCEPSA
jgi:ribonucleoside-diphosphate reductase alpha chain